MTCGDLPLMAPVGSSKGHMHSESLDMGLSGFIGAGLILFLAVRTLAKSSLREIGIGFIWFMIPNRSWPLWGSQGCC